MVLLVLQLFLLGRAFLLRHTKRHPALGVGSMFTLRFINLRRYRDDATPSLCSQIPISRIIGQLADVEASIGAGSPASNDSRNRDGEGKRALFQNSNF